MKLTEFLEARIAEDEYDASRELLLGTTTVLTRMNTRVLAECAAKRALLTLFRSGLVFEVMAPDGTKGPVSPLQLMALPYKDHPDYREEWSSAT